ncbi:hypothetical protein IX51_01240 [uncultured archaeon]|nr:hypothetical protein IX51_01240 [uncultured archaeon]HKJ96695.1 hypothetical protein [Thermoplasmataceae archaeon]
MNALIEVLIYPISSFILISAFYLQAQEFVRSMVIGQMIQSALLGFLSFVIGFAESDYDFFILGVLIVVLRAFLVTYMLERRVPREKIHLHEKKVDVAFTFLVNLILVVTAVFLIYFLIFRSIHLVPDIGSSTIFIFPLTLFFQGLFLIASRKTTFAQIIGYVEEENALVLFAMFLLPIPLIIEASVFLDVLALVVVSSIVVIEKFAHEKMEDLVG